MVSASPAGEPGARASDGPPAPVPPPPPGRGRSRPLAGTGRLAWLGLLVAPLVLLGPTLLRGRAFLPQVPAALEPYRSEDPARAARAAEGQSYLTSDRLFPALTDQLALREAARAGSVALWEPDLGLGVPLFAQSIAGPAYPPNWLALVVDPARAAGPLAVLSLVLAGAGAFVFLRRLGLVPPACWLGAVAYQAGGWGLVNLHYFMKVDAALYLPWCLWAVEGIRRGRRGAGAFLSLALAASLVAGFPPVGLFVAGGTALYALLVALRDAGTTRVAPRATGLPPTLASGLFLVLGVAGAAVALWPMAEASAASHRQDQDVAALVAQTPPAQALAGVVLADLFGDPRAPTPPGHLPTAWWLTPREQAPAAEIANPLEWNAYAGGFVVVLALAGLVGRPRQAWIPALLLCGTLAFATGGWPVRWLYALPGLSAGHPVRVLALAWFLWPWLAALGLDALLERLRRARWTALAVSGVALLAGGLGAWRTDPEAWTEALERTLVARYDEIIDAEAVRVRLPRAVSLAAGEGLVRAYGLLALAGLGGVLLALRLRRPCNAAWVPVAVILGVLAEGAAGAGQHVTGHRLPDGSFPPSASLDAVARAAGDARVIRLDRSPSGVADVEVLARPNMLQPYGIADVTPWILFPPRTFNELFAAFDPDARKGQGVSRLSDPALLGHPLLDLLRIGAVLSREPVAHARLEPVLERPGFCVYRRSGALGPARVVRGVQVATTDAAGLLGLAQGAVDFATTTMLSLDGDDALLRLPPPAREPGEVVAFERTGPNRIRVHARAPQGGWLVVHEQHAAGWSATRNGEPVALRRADHVYQALPLVPGENLVELVYRPRSVRLGFGVSVLALALALLLSRLLRT